MNVLSETCSTKQAKEISPETDEPVADPSGYHLLKRGKPRKKGGREEEEKEKEEAGERT